MHGRVYEALDGHILKAVQCALYKWQDESGGLKRQAHVARPRQASVHVVNRRDTIACASCSGIRSGF